MELDEVIADYRARIKAMDQKGDQAMIQFLDIIANSLYDVCGTVGHVGIINPNYFRELDVYTTEILEEGRTAYIRVDSFEDSLMEEDLPKIRAFLEQVRDYEHLILDIQENGGGNTACWEQAFVAPNIDEPVASRLVRMMKDTPLAQQFYGADYKVSDLSAEEVFGDPQFAQMPREDMEGLTLAREITDVTQAESGEMLFRGKIWLLAGPEVYSSAETFAVFCKDTGFATLVGQTTGGSDSGGPNLYELPASHLLIQFDVEYCLNADGSCNQETGTAPDIQSENPLETVLELIAQG